MGVSQLCQNHQLRLGGRRLAAFEIITKPAETTNFVEESMLNNQRYNGQDMREMQGRGGRGRQGRRLAKIIDGFRGS
jgi:hypothetical protein